MNTKGIFATIAILATLAACGPALRDHVASAADKRDVVCGLAKNTPAGDPTIDRVKALCEGDADLQEIARAYAGCGE